LLFISLHVLISIFILKNPRSKNGTGLRLAIVSKDPVCLIFFFFFLSYLIWFPLVSPGFFRCGCAGSCKNCHSSIRTYE
jgi:hypothetical protein